MLKIQSRTVLVILLTGLLFGNVYATEEELAQRISKLEQEVGNLNQQIENLTQKINALFNTLDKQTPLIFELPSVASQQLSVKRWFYRPEQVKFNTHYALDIEFYNGFDEEIVEIDARLNFRSLLGAHLYSVPITSNLKIPAGETVIDKGSRQNDRFLGKGHQMLHLEIEDIKAILIVRKLVFANGKVLSF